MPPYVVLMESMAMYCTLSDARLVKVSATKFDIHFTVTTEKAGVFSVGFD